jgi:hypothetical protein
MLENNQHVVAGPGCAACGTCCFNTCGEFISPAGTCYPACQGSFQFLPSLDLAAATIVAKQTETQKLGVYDPDATDGLQYPVGVAIHNVKTDTNGRITNFVNTTAYAPGCGPKVGVIFYSGDFPEEMLHNGDQAIINAMLEIPNFARRLPNGNIRIF